MQDDAINSKCLNSNFVVAINQPLLQIEISRQVLTFVFSIKQMSPITWRRLSASLDGHELLNLAVQMISAQAGFSFLMFFYQFNIPDYTVGTVHLSNLEDLAYRRLLDLYYDTEQPIPLETQWVAKRLRLDTETVATVLSEFFVRTENGWINHRCDIEIQRYRSLSERNRRNGKAGGRPTSPDKDGKNNRSVASRNPVGSQRQPTGKPTMNYELRTKNYELNIPLTPLGGSGNVDSLTDSKPEAGQDPGNDKIISTSRQTPEVEDDFDPTGARPHPRHLLDIWNDCCRVVPELPRVREVTFKPGTKRWKTAKTRLKEIPDLGYWERAIQRIAASPFCQGENDRGWKCDFDFVLKPDSHIKAFEGKYDRK